MRRLLLALCALALFAGCHVYSYYPVAPPPGHVHEHDGHGHCLHCGLYYSGGAYYAGPPHGWAEIYGPPGPAYPPYHTHVHDGHGHCTGCGWYYHHERWYDHRPEGWFEFHYRH